MDASTEKALHKSKKRGRPATGTDRGHTLRIPDDLWARMRGRAAELEITPAEAFRQAAEAWLADGGSAAER